MKNKGGKMFEDDVKRELMMFKEISSIDDYKKVTGEEISYSDYQRLGYILDTIGFDNLSIHLCNKHCGKFEEKETQLEKMKKEYAILNSEEDNIDVYYEDLSEEWLREFVMNIKDKSIREKIMYKVRITE